MGNGIDLRLAMAIERLAAAVEQINMSPVAHLADMANSLHRSSDLLECIVTQEGLMVNNRNV